MSVLIRKIIGAIVSLLSVNALADEIVRMDGVYVSNASFEKYDQKWFRHYLIFYADGIVRKGACDEKFDVDKIMNAQPTLGYGKYAIKGKSIQMSIRVPGFDYETTWQGSFDKQNIHFSVKNPDFLDIPGLYTFHKSNGAPNKSSHSPH